jgi:predicted DNA repair protein MutK
MASGIFAILDDIAALMDDVAITIKVATRKTAGILGDDLAVNAEKATGFVSSRELPVLWSITKGSLLNKVIIVPIALLLSAFLPVAIQVALVLGGCYLAYEGVEKIVEFLFHRNRVVPILPAETELDAAALEKKKIKSAVTTDFILSVEIVIIALGAVVDASLTLQIVTVSLVALIATIGVYGIVAMLVRLDDLGYRILSRSGERGFGKSIGHILVRSLPGIIRILSFVGTIALILVSGGIFVHNISFLHDLLPGVPSILKELGVGIAAGILVLLIVAAGKRIYLRFKNTVRKS